MGTRSAISIIVALMAVAGIAIAALLMAMNSSDGGADPTVSEQPAIPQATPLASVATAQQIFANQLYWGVTDPNDSFPEPRGDEFGESDLFLNVATGDVFELVGGQWAFPSVGSLTGPSGPWGTGWYWGNGAPGPGNVVSRGQGFQTGDLYLDATTGEIYGYAADGWPEMPLGSLRSPAGAPGNRWYWGQGAPIERPPAPREGGFVPGDLYLDIGSGEVYEHEVDAWGTSPIFALIQHSAGGLSRWRLGLGHPDSALTGRDELALEDGDLYLDANSGRIYRFWNEMWLLLPAASGSGGTGGTQPAASGPDGNRWYWGMRAPGQDGPVPIGAEFQSGDLFLNVANGNVHQFDGSQWDSVPLGSLQGPSGSDGSDGSDGGRGPAGPSGAAQGPPGVPGQPGPQGPAGVRGPTGVEGLPGEQGPVGAMGPRGEPGAPGPQGLRGEQGLVGSRGEQGSPGEQGPVGLRGQQGSSGNQGLLGLRGQQGSSGNQGAEGPIGPRGDPGDKGATGDQGPAGGAVGPQGPQGPPGERGEAGRIGRPGKTGLQGDSGVQGSQWYFGSSNPTDNPPGTRGSGFNVGDMYFDITGCGIYAYESAGWGASPIVTLSGCS